MLYIKIFYNILTLNTVECQLSSIPGMHIISYWPTSCPLGTERRIFWALKLNELPFFLFLRWGILKEISPEYSLKDRCWSWNSSTLDTSWEELTHWKRPWCWERLKAGGEGDKRGWDGWLASPTQQMWVWINSGDGQGGLACCSPWGRKESDTTKRLNWRWGFTGVLWTSFSYFPPVVYNPVIF